MPFRALAHPGPGGNSCAPAFGRPAFWLGLHGWTGWRARSWRRSSAGRGIVRSSARERRPCRGRPSGSSVGKWAVCSWINPMSPEPLDLVLAPSFRGDVRRPALRGGLCLLLASWSKASARGGEQASRWAWTGNGAAEAPAAARWRIRSGSSEPIRAPPVEASDRGVQALREAARRPNSRQRLRRCGGQSCHRRGALRRPRPAWPCTQVSGDPCNPGRRRE
jgi:hypothetical protein